MRHGVLATLLIGAGYILQRPKVNEDVYYAEYMAESMIGSKGKLKGVVYPILSTDIRAEYHTILSPLISDKLWKRIIEVNNIPRFSRRKEVNAVFEQWLDSLLKVYSKEGSTPTDRIMQARTIGSAIDDAFMHNRHSRGQFKTENKNRFMDNFLTHYIGIPAYSQHDRIICGMDDRGELEFKPYSIAWLSTISSLKLKNLYDFGIEEYRLGPVGTTTKGKAKQEYYAYVHDTYIENTGVKPIIPTLTDTGIKGGRVDTNDNAGIWLTEKKSNNVLSKAYRSDGIKTNASKQSEAIIEQKVMLDLNAQLRNLIDDWERNPRNKFQLPYASNDPYYIYSKQKRNYTYVNVGLIPPYAGWGLNNTVELFEEYLNGWDSELKKWLPKIRKADKKDDKVAIEKWLMDDSEPPEGQDGWVDESLSSWSGKKRSHTQIAKRESWFEQQYMKGNEMDYSTNYYTGSRGYGLNRLSNNDIMALIPKSEAKRLITKYTKEQNEIDKNTDEWRKVRDAKLKKTIANLK